MVSTTFCLVPSSRAQSSTQEAGTAENPGSAVDVKEDTTIVLCNTVGRHHVERARPGVALFDCARELLACIADHRTDEAICLGDIRLPPFDVVECWKVPRGRSEPAHGQNGLRLLAD